MAKKIVIHCGLPRCASTSLQYFFARNSALLAEHGIDYPNFLGVDDSYFRSSVDLGNAYALFYSLLPDQNITGNLGHDYNLRDLRTYLTESPASRDILLSSEWFTELGMDGITSLFETIASCGYDLEIVCVYRPMADFCLSLYSQGARYSPSPLPFEEYFLDWEEWGMRRMAAVIGASRLLAADGKSVRFIRLSEPGGERLELRFLSTFWPQTGNISNELDFFQSRNSSLSQFSVALQTLLKRSGRQLGREQVEALDRFLVARIPGLSAITLFKVPFETQRQILETFSTALTEGFGKHVPASLHPDLLFEPSEKLAGINTPDDDPPRLDQLSAEVTELLLREPCGSIDRETTEFVISAVRQGIATKQAGDS